MTANCRAGLIIHWHYVLFTQMRAISVFAFHSSSFQGYTKKNLCPYLQRKEIKALRYGSIVMRNGSAVRNAFFPQTIEAGEQN